MRRLPVIRHLGHLRPLMCVIAACSSAVLAGCAISPPAPEQLGATAAPISPAAAEARHHEDRQTRRAFGSNPAVRRAAALVQTGALLTKVAYIDPLIRPLSTDAALLSLVLKSTGGFARRTAIDTVQLQRLEREPIPPLAHGPGMDLEQWERDLDEIGGVASSGTIELLIDGDEYFPRMIDAVENAQHSIDIRTYIFDNDDYAVQVADLLISRSEDIKIRVLLDGIGALLGVLADSENLPADHRPPVSMTTYLRNDSDLRVRIGGNPWLTGDHTKTTIVDGRQAFVGGMNIGREYRYEWHDLMMEVTGPIVDVLQRDSDRAWASASVFGDFARAAHAFKRPDQRVDDSGYPIRALYTRNFNSQIYRAQLAAIRRAESYIFIENPYFSDDAMLYELAKARPRGVDVRVILADQGNHGLLNSSNAVATNIMLRNGIRVYRYPGMSHIKAAVYDGWACVGSANFDKLSLQVNKELNLATSHPEAVDELLARVFAADFARSEEVLAPLPVNWINYFAELASDELL